MNNLAEKVDECPLIGVVEYCLRTIGTVKTVRYMELAGCPVFFCFCFVLMVLPGMTQLTRKSPIALRLILRGFPPKDVKENLLLSF